jgi:YjbE family integral membrane protein
MDWAAWGLDRLDWLFFARALNIVIINLILSGDNAVVIAMAVRSLSRRQRRWGISLGAGIAVFLRVALTFFAAQLLEIQFLKLIGGALIAWIAVKLFLKGTVEQRDQEVASLLQATILILVADLTMSLDNVLAIAAISNGNLFLLIFGLAVSVPFVIFTSSLLSMLMDRYPIIVYLGSAILGRVAGEMVLSDPFVVRWLAPPPWLSYTVEAACALGVIVVGKFLVWLMYKKAEELEAPQESLASPGSSLPTRRSKER